MRWMRRGLAVALILSLVDSVLLFVHLLLGFAR